MSFTTPKINVAGEYFTVFMLADSILKYYPFSLIQSMLKEVQSQNGQYGRRWFSADRSDLYVWQAEHGDIVGFEYCYRLLSAEYSLRWNQGREFEHLRIDDGEYSPLSNDTPIALSAVAPDWGLIKKHFRQQGVGLDRDLFQFVIEKMHQASLLSNNHIA